jgi:hypothetical protein
MKEPANSNLTVAMNALGIAGVMLIMAGLIWIMYHFTQPGPVDQSRWVERKRNLSEITAQTRDQLENYAWMDRDRGVVRLPIARAVDLTIREWENPSAGRSNLLARLDRATPPAAIVPATNTPATPVTK